ncbi:hypothetical protein [Novosphingobium terrae]|uniref:hypothetical protein n=1 Tax=Novosphingobium terrae TaxID=2726189 RepID=UPI00197EA8C3|nr:hypothetical protein [Novosphingobium terrae]
MADPLKIDAALAIRLSQSAPVKPTGNRNTRRPTQVLQQEPRPLDIGLSLPCILPARTVTQPGANHLTVIKITSIRHKPFLVRLANDSEFRLQS